MSANDSKLIDAVRHIDENNDFLLKKLIWNYPDLIKQPMKNGDLLIHYAVQKGKLAAVKVLLGCDDWKEQDTVVRMFNFFGWWLPPQNDVNLGDNQDNTPLHYAVVLRKVEIAMFLLENGANPNLKDEHGYTPLHYAAERGDVEIARLLLEKGANLNAGDKYDSTPLQCALAKGHVEIVRLLLENGAFSNLKNQHGQTLLHFAVLMGYRDIAALLIAHKADINAADNQGHTPLYMAVERGNRKIAELLVTNGADINQVESKCSDNAMMCNFLKRAVLDAQWEMSISGHYDSFFQWLPREVSEDIMSLVAKTDSLSPKNSR